MNTVICHTSKQEVKLSDSVKVRDIRDDIVKLIRRDFPDIDGESCISLSELNRYRRLYLSSLITQETGELNELDQEVIEAMTQNRLLSENPEEKMDESITTGQRIADRIAAFGGSWTFIIIFGLFLFVWMTVNVWVLAAHPFDPYPFILLNLILSSLAAIQAPVIMMSQNRKEYKDRQRSEQDYQVNLKAELEIKLLHEKIDHLMMHQNKRLLEIQQIQTDYLEDITKEIKSVTSHRGH